MDRYRRMPRITRNRGLVDDTPKVSPYFPVSESSTSKSSITEKPVKTYSSKRKLIEQDLDSFTPEGWDKPAHTSTRTTRSSSGTLKPASWTANVENFDLSEDSYVYQSRDNKSMVA